METMVIQMAMLVNRTGHQLVDNVNMTLQRRIREVAFEKSLNRNQIAIGIGANRQTVGGWFNGVSNEIASKYLFSVEKFLGVYGRWLNTGEGPKYVKPGLYERDEGLQTGSNRSNVSEGAIILGGAPLITKEQAGSLKIPINLNSLENLNNYHPVPILHGENTFTLRIEGDSMVSSDPLGYSYLPGDLIFVDPDSTDNLSSGDRVLVKLNDESLDMDRRVLFKQLIIDGPNEYLRSINDKYSDIHDEFEIIGKVIGKWSD